MAVVAGGADVVGPAARELDVAVASALIELVVLVDAVVMAVELGPVVVESAEAHPLTRMTKPTRAIWRVRECKCITLLRHDVAPSSDIRNDSYSMRLHENARLMTSCWIC